MEEPVAQRRSTLVNDSDNDKLEDSVLVQQTSEETTAAEVDVASATESYNVWCMDDIEGVVMELLDEIVVGSASLSMEKIVNNRLFGYVAACGLSVIDEVLASAIARSGDSGVDSNDESVLNNPRALLGRSGFSLESLDAPRKCAMDESYQRRQVPIRAPKQNLYDNEGFHRAVKAATRSYARPSSITSSRRTVKSKVRKKQDVTTISHGESTDPRPGVPYSTEVPHKGRLHTVSPRKLVTVNYPASADNTVEAGLQLNIDTDCIQDKTEESTGSRRSPPPLSKSPMSVTSLRRRPQPPLSAQPTKTTSFGEKEEEVKVEFTIQKAPPRRISMSAPNALPYIDRSALRPSLPFPAFSAITDSVDDQSRDGDPLDQHFHAMPLSPGVKVRAGEESNDGPELPSFASKMTRSTFVRMDTSTLPTQASNALTPRARTSSPTDQDAVQKIGKGTFLTETEAWEFSAADRRSAESQVIQGQNRHQDSNDWIKADGVLSAELTTSCSCASSSSLTLFRKQSKVQRPCRSCSNESNRRETMTFSNLVKQRAFHMKPPCLPTSSSPSKRAPPGASPRRVTSAPASSPLARRNLLISKTTDQLLNKDLERATQII